MKKLILLFIVGGMIVTFFPSCSGDKSQNGNTDSATSELNVEDEITTDVIDPSAKVIEIEISANGNTMAEINYDKKEIVIPAGCAVKIIFINNSTDQAMPHNILFIERGSAQLVVDEGMKVGQNGGFRPDLKEVFAGSKLLGSGEKDEFIFMAPAPGEYQFICSFPGHLQAMNGRFIVEE